MSSQDHKLPYAKLAKTMPFTTSKICSSSPLPVSAAGSDFRAFSHQLGSPPSSRLHVFHRTARAFSSQSWPVSSTAVPARDASRRTDSRSAQRRGAGVSGQPGADAREGPSRGDVPAALRRRHHRDAGADQRRGRLDRSPQRRHLHADQLVVQPHRSPAPHG
eukprot:scaffold1954_cov268-Pinguiococcus_pyrenoidosus.AAC.211